MGSAFNPHILVEKLAKLNNTQASIETLSHWCIFHMNKAKQVVETWGKEFHLSPRDQRLAFLHLANDILQNSRRKGADFVGEFWKVLPDCLRDVIENGDESGRNAALRLVGIWEERKVFGSRGQFLKEELVRKHRENSNRNGKHLGSKLKQPVGGILDKVISDYRLAHGGQMDEDMILNKCRKAIGYLEQVERDIGGGDINSEQFHEASFVEELQGQRGVLRDSIEQLTTLESSMASLVSHLREALQEKEAKLQQIRVQLQAAQSQSEHTESLWQQLMHSNNMKFATEQSSKEANASMASERFTSGDGEQSAPSMYTRQVSFPENTSHVEEDPRKSAAAAVAAKLTASTSSAQMLSFVLSSLASEGVIVNPVKEQQDDHPAEKRAKHESDQPYIPTQAPSQTPLPPFQHHDSFHHNVTTSAQQPTTTEPPPPPPSSPPPLPPLPPVQQPYTMAQYMQTTGSVNGVQYSYSVTQQQPSIAGYPTGNGMPMTGISPFTMPTSNSYQTYQGSEGNLYNQSSSMPMAPISRQ